ncbi:MAG: F0F1 ATP synthase subunit delta [Rhodospirillales bacterium]
MTSATAGSTGLAGRYASALFELASSAGAVDSVAAEMQALDGLIQESADFRRLIASPVIGRASQWQAVDAILKAAGMSDLAGRFIGVITENRRLFVLPDIIRAYLQRVAEERGQTRVEVVSAKPLTDAQQEAITRALQKAVSKQIALTTRTDPGLLGGLVVQVGSRMIDSSLKSKLKRLSLAIKGVA